MLFADQAGAPAHGGTSIAPVRNPGTIVLDDYELPEYLAVAARFGTQKYGYVLTPNVDGFIRLHESESCRAAYAQASHVLLDSRVAGFVFRLAHRLQVPVCPGSDLTAALLHHVIGADDRVLLIGSTEKQAQILRDRFGLKHLIHHNPPMGFIRDPAAVEACLQFIESASPFRFCLIAIGDPQGFMIAHRLAERDRARGLAFIIGASIDFITGHQRRAPAWMQRMGLEWLYRLSRNPRRLAWRYLVRGPKFFFYYLSTSRVVLRQAQAQAK
jgi:exopolysaccharide biosynthesis WecB/TagA/CpsF family protein